MVQLEELFWILLNYSCAFTHCDIKSHRRTGKFLQQMFVCNRIITIITNIVLRFSIFLTILIFLIYIYHSTSMTQVVITIFFFVEYLHEDGRKRPRRRATPCLCIAVSNYSTVVGTHSVTTVLASASRGWDYHLNMSGGSIFRLGFKALIRRIKVRSDILYTYANRNL